MLNELESLISNEKYEITLLSNVSAFLNEKLHTINWVGFYLYLDGQLVLGPFQGKVACEIIPLSKGVCGKAATDRQTVLVEDVHKFPGHIACDSASQSEIVLPIILDGQLYGVLDIDSPVISRFTQNDKQTLEQCVEIIIKRLNEIKSI